MSDCRLCGTVLEPVGEGRPPRYCGEACRREAEFKIRRENRAIERLEKQRDGLEQEIARLNGSPGNERMLVKVAEQIERAEGKLRELLDG